jgi:flagellar basal-body rod protein FlgF
MENTFLVSLSQQLAARRSMEVIANNLANVSTPAFKREEVQFQEYVTPVQATEAEGGGTTNISFVLDHGVARDLSEGNVETTNAPFDFALSGGGYFVVQTPQGERYTRNGHFMLDEGGRLVTGDGFPVQGEGGEIAIQLEDGDLHAASDGMLSTDQQQIGKLRVVGFADERALRKAGSSFYTAEGQAPTAAANVRVSQGMIEKSNVEPVLEIAHMIEVMRAYQSCASLTQSGEDMLRQAIEKLGAMPQA